MDPDAMKQLSSSAALGDVAAEVRGKLQRVMAAV
jgi:hypothetical protein